MFQCDYCDQAGDDPMHFMQRNENNVFGNPLILCLECYNDEAIREILDIHVPPEE